MTEKEFNVRLAKLGIKMCFLVTKIKERAGLNSLQANEVSAAKNGRRTGPKSQKILKALDEILTDMERRAEG